MSDVAQLLDTADAIGVAAAIRAGDVDAREVVAEALDRIAQRDPAINAFTSLRAEAALDEVAAGLPDGPLGGVPFAVKDLGTDVAGLPSTNGSRLFAQQIAERDSLLVERYRAAGLVIVGRTNTPELGKNASTEPLLHGPTRNPHGLDRSSGGSSGGTAAAVAAGMVPAGHGNDGGGSIRIPSAMCGLVGLKPSRSRTPNLPKRATYTYPLAVHHALTRSVRDSALLLDIAAGPAPGDAYVIAPPVRPYLDEVGAPVERLRVALSVARPGGEPVDAECERAARDAARLLEELGHDVVEAEPTYATDGMGLAMSVVMRASLVNDVDARLAVLGRELRDDDLEPFTRMMYDLGQQMSAQDLVDALAHVEAAGHALGPFLADYDVVVAPTVAARTPPLGFLDTTSIEAMVNHGATYSAMTAQANYTGVPAISLPLATDTDGMPLGVQFIAGFGREDLLLRLAAQIEVAAPWPTTPVWPPRPTAGVPGA